MRPGPIMLGQYRPLNSYLHRLDARSKILPIMVILILSLFSNSSLFYSNLLAALWLSLIFSGVSFSTLWQNFRAIFILVLITAAYHLIFSSGEGEPIFSLFGWDLTREALDKALYFSLRLILFVSVAFLVTLTNSPSELAEAFVKLAKPLRFLKIPIDDLAMIVFIAIRFIPILYEEFIAIKNAQMMRGVDFNGGFINRIRKSVVIIVPVFVAAIQRADDLALAIEARGYRAVPERTMYSRTRFGGAEVIFSIGSVAYIATLFWITG